MLQVSHIGTNLGMAFLILATLEEKLAVSYRAKDRLAHTIQPSQVFTQKSWKFMSTQNLPTNVYSVFIHNC